MQRRSCDHCRCQLSNHLLFRIGTKRLRFSTWGFKGSGVGWPVSHGSSQASVPSSLALSVSLSLSLSLSPHLPPLISMQRLKFPLNRCTFTCKFPSQQILDPHQAEIVELVPARHIHDAVAGVGRQHLCSSAGRFWALRVYDARFQLGSNP